MWTHNIFELVTALFAGGVVCGALWELSRLQRIFFGLGERAEFSVKKKDIFVFLFVLFQDFSFFVSAACVIAVSFYYGNNGNFRIFALLFALIGGVLYVKTVGELTEKAAIWIRRIFISFFAWLKHAFKRVIDIINIKKKLKSEHKSKEAIGIGKHQNCKIVGDKGGGKRAFHKSKPLPSKQRSDST